MLLLAEDKLFYDAKLKTAAFMFDHLLPRTRSLKISMFTPAASMMDITPRQFSFDHAL